jgi:hypothetical protein
MTATLFPAGFGEFEVRLGNSRPSHAVYVRRRLVVGLVLLLLGTLTLLGVRTMLADRGGVPASTLAIRPASALAQPEAAPAVATPTLATPADPAAVAAVYVVRSGDTIWSVAEDRHGGRSIDDYVEALIDSNGGTSLQVGQQLVLP